MVDLGEEGGDAGDDVVEVGNDEAVVRVGGGRSFCRGRCGYLVEGWGNGVCVWGNLLSTAWEPVYRRKLAFSSEAVHH